MAKKIKTQGQSESNAASQRAWCPQSSLPMSVRQWVGMELPADSFTQLGTIALATPPRDMTSHCRPACRRSGRVRDRRGGS